MNAVRSPAAMPVQLPVRPVAHVGLIEIRCPCRRLLCMIGPHSTVAIVCPQCKTHVTAFGNLTPPAG